MSEAQEFATHIVDLLDSYYKKEKEYQLSCYLAPEDSFEEPDACLRWARLAFDAALRNPNKKSKRR